MAKSGLKILKKNERYLASSVDPIREAHGIAAKACVGLGVNESVIILGLGCGYHVLEIEALRPAGSVLTIEADHAVFSAAVENCPRLLQSKVLVEPNFLDLVNHEMFRSAVCAPFRIVTHGPSLQSEREFYGHVERLLLGRDRLSFLLLLKTRPELMAQLDPDAISKIGDSAITVKTMQGIFGSHASLSRERRLWRILEELVV